MRDPESVWSQISAADADASSVEEVELREAGSVQVCQPPSKARRRPNEGSMLKPLAWDCSLRLAAAVGWAEPHQTWWRGRLALPASWSGLKVTEGWTQNELSPLLFSYCRGLGARTGSRPDFY